MSSQYSREAYMRSVVTGALAAFIIPLIVMLSAGCSGGGSATIVADGKSPYAIVLCAKPSPSERHAADELKSHIALATGAELPVVAETDARAAQPPRIFVGFGDAAGKILAGSKTVSSDSLGDEGFIIRTVKNGGADPDIVVAGGRLRGTMYGVYTLLDKLGFRWYTPRVTRFPDGKTLKATGLDETTVPVFMYREPFIKEAFDGDWAARNRVNSGAAALDSTRGGNVAVLGVHTFDQLIPPSLFKDHPEYFPLIGGERVTGYVQRCLTNPAVVDIAAKNLIAWMDSDPAHHIFTLSQNDVEKYCECPECKKIMDAEGAPSGLYITFVNKVAEIVEKRHPENYVCTLAYMFSEKPPKTVKPRKNVLVRLCPIYMCAGHPFSACTSPETKEFAATLAGWGKLTDQIFIWHYATDFSSYLIPFPNFLNFSQSIKTYAKSGVSGIFMQGAYTSPGSSDAELRAWVMARLLWNPAADTNTLVNEWMRAVYGKAVTPMRAVFDLTHKRFADPSRHLRIFSMPSRELWPEAVVASMDSLYKAAATFAEGDSTAVYYVAKNRLSVEYLKLYLNSGRLAVKGPVYAPEGNTVTADDCAKFMDELKKFGVTALCEEPFDCNHMTLLGERFREHPVVAVENGDLRVVVAPDLGGRIVDVVLKKTGAQIVGRTDPTNYFYPASGGYEESTTRTWASTGFANPYTTDVKGRTITLTGKGHNGLVFKRTITLPETGARIEIGSSVTNATKSPLIARLVMKMEINAAPDSATVLAGASSEKAADFYRDGAKKPAGSWSVTSTSGGWSMEHRFSAADIEACRLACDRTTGTVTMEASGFERDLAPGKGISLKQVWEIKESDKVTK